jgi:predicted porin
MTAYRPQPIPEKSAPASLTELLSAARCCRLEYLVMLAAGGLLLACTASQAAPPSADRIEALERQLEQQLRIMEQMQRQLDEQRRITQEIMRENQSIKQQAMEANSTARQVQASISEAPAVTSGGDRIKLTVSGQVNRALNVAGDGDKTKLYNVDNDTSNSRFRLVGTARVSDHLTLGTQLEAAFSPNNSGEVSQDDETPGDKFDQRKAELFAESTRYGKLWLGKGQSASDDSAERDLSGTDVVQYASHTDIAGGLKFRSQKDDSLTDIRLSDAFSDFDGNGRTNRVRYDTPTFRGFHLRADASADQEYAASLWWAGQGYGLRIASAAAISKTDDRDVDNRVDGSFSVLHEHTGLNLTLSAGRDDLDDGGNPSQVYLKAGWLADLFDLGKTATGIDFGRSTNLPTPENDGTTVGAALVQQIPDWGTELYMQYRWYTLDGAGVEDIHVGTMGARVKF